MSEIRRGVALNYLGIALANLTGLLLTPFMIYKLGDAEYGVYSTIGALVASLALLDLGLNNTVTRFVADYRARQDLDGQQRFITTVLMIYAVLSSAVVLGGAVCYISADALLDEMSAEQIALARTLLVILTANLALRLPGSVFTGICYAYELFTVPKTLDLLRYVVRATAIALALLLGGRSVSIVVIDTALYAIFHVAICVFAVKRTGFTFRFTAPRRTDLNAIFRYSIWVFGLALVETLQWRAGHVALGSLASAESLAIYGVGLMLGGYYGAFSAAITGVFLPRAIQMVAREASSRELTSAMVVVARHAFIVLGFILTSFLVFGRQFVRLWLGENYEPAWLIATMIMLAYTVPLLQAFANSLLQARNLLAFKAVLYATFMLIGVTVGYYLAMDHGPVGMVFGSILAWVAAQVAMNIYYHRVMMLDVPRFFLSTGHRLIPAATLAGLCGLAVDLLPGEGWWAFVEKVSLYGVVYAALIYCLGMLPSERSTFRGVLASARDVVARAFAR